MRSRRRGAGPQNREFEKVLAGVLAQVLAKMGMMSGIPNSFCEPFRGFGVVGSVDGGGDPKRRAEYGFREHGFKHRAQ